MLADYYHRNAVAAAQVLAGFDEEWFRSRLESTPVGISLGRDARSPEGRALSDLLVRITARLYPSLAIVGDPAVQEPLAQLAKAINPNIDLVQEATLGVCIGSGEPFAKTIYAGCDGWEGLVSAHAPRSLGKTKNPFGAGVAACIAAAGLFRAVFLPDWEERVDQDVRFSAMTGDHLGSPGRAAAVWRLREEAVLVGAGAVGQGALWALSRAPIRGRLHVIDLEFLELSNLQRYVLTERADEGRDKAELAAELESSLTIVPHSRGLAAFFRENGFHWDMLLLALDTAQDRVGAQASLPRFVVNAWTQPGDLGVSSHSRFGDAGSCVGCLYQPDARIRNEDELVAETLGVPHLLLQVRTLLATGQPVDRGLLEATAAAVLQPLEALLPFEGRTLRELYVEGFCGGAVIPIGEAGQPYAGAQGVHVPLAHQSALAGVLLAAALACYAFGGPEDLTQVTRLNVLRAIGPVSRQPSRARRDGRCMCDDPDFTATYAAKYDPSPLWPSGC